MIHGDENKARKKSFYWEKGERSDNFLFLSQVASQIVQNRSKRVPKALFVFFCQENFFIGCQEGEEEMLHHHCSFLQQLRKHRPSPDTVMRLQSKNSLPLLTVLSASTLSPTQSLFFTSSCPFFECPTDDSYPQSCLDSAIPPWPICKFHTAESWVDSAKDSATRCCGDDISECKCPKKDTQRFQDRIDEWCDAVLTCP